MSDFVRCDQCIRELREGRYMCAGCRNNQQTITSLTNALDVAKNGLDLALQLPKLLLEALMTMASSSETRSITDQQLAVLLGPNTTLAEIVKTANPDDLQFVPLRTRTIGLIRDEVDEEIALILVKVCNNHLDDKVVREARRALYRLTKPAKDITP